MASKKTSKKQQELQQQKTIRIIVICLVVLVVIGIIVLYETDSDFRAVVDARIEEFFNPNTEDPNKEDPNKEDPNKKEPSKTSDPQVYDGIVKDEFSIHFIAAENDKAGDAIYIKAGDVDILIDAGPRQSSSENIANYMNNYVTDGKLEFVIATHADQDHIAGFVGTKAAPSIFERYECETIIDFPLSDKTTELYANYQKARDAEIALGAKHYTALECYNNQNGAKRIYTLADGITMEVLYNYFYENHSSDENNYSVCLLFTENDHKYLLTGDLEEKGEEYLIQYNTLTTVDFFKAGHHGSPTSTTEELLAVIQPQICVVTCCAGTDEYTKTDANQFPSQAFVSHISKYTEKVFVTNQVDETSKFKAMNGTVIIGSSKGEDIHIYCTVSTTLLKDTDWFKAHRVWE